MKALVIAMFAAGAGLLLAALLWPGREPPQAQQNRRNPSIVQQINVREPQPVETRNNAPVSPPPPATPAMPTRAAEETRTIVNIPLTPPPPPSATSDAPNDPSLTPNEQLTFKQTGTDDTSLRDADFPRTYISKIHVDLTGPNQWVTLTWLGPNARLHPPTQYHSSPGRGLGYNNCDDSTESCRVDSNCTPKGTMHVESFSNSMQGSPEVRFVTWFDTKRGIALHYYPNVPNYPASHGCVRLDEYAARLIHNNSKIGETEVVIEGKWTFVR
jgi:hypothetical protein